MSIINTKKEELDISDAVIVTEEGTDIVSVGDEEKTDTANTGDEEKSVSNDIYALKKAVKKVHKRKNKPEPKEKWEDLDAIYNACAKGIINVAEGVNEYVGNLREYPSIFINNETTIAVSGLARDLETFTKNLLKIRSRYENKTGVIKTDEEHALSIDIALDYVKFNDKFIANASEPLIILTEQLLEIKDKYMADRKAKEEAGLEEKQDSTETQQNTEGGVSE